MQPQSPHQLPYISVERKDLHQLEVRLLSTPGMKVSYEINSYKQLSGDSFYIIPKGKKCVVWFTASYKAGIPTAIFYELDPRDHTKIKFISLREPHPACAKLNPDMFSNNGTICYGTLFSAQEHQFFSVENIFVYKGRALDALCVRDKRSLITEMFDDGLGFSDGSPSAPSAPSCDNGHKARVWFGIPIRCASYADALKAASTIASYSVYAIQARFDKQTDNKYFQNCQNQNQSTLSHAPLLPPPPPPPQQQQSIQLPTQHVNRYLQQQQHQQPHQQQQQRARIFIIRAEPQADIYTLQCPDTGKIEPDHAHIGDYKTSVFMNSVFRKIRENASLDAAEESDEEEEFQKTHHENSHTNLEKNARILCAFNYRFKRWTPLKLAS